MTRLSNPQKFYSDLKFQLTIEQQLSFQCLLRDEVKIVLALEEAAPRVQH
jgi:hypothetical protein